MYRFSILAGLVLLSMTSAMAQKIQGVHPDSSPIQIGVGFTFVSFNEAPNAITNSAGFNASAVYYQDPIGVEAEVSDAFGSHGGKSGQLLFTGGGARLRWPTGRTIQPWVHGLVGYSHLSPQPSFGNDSAFGFKAGGGLDFNPHRSRLSYRVSVDMFGSHFFRTYQFSPEVSAGVVLSLSRPQ
jgi:hypothetical protein